MVLGKNLFPIHLGCWQNSVPYNCMTRVSIFLSVSWGLFSASGGYWIAGLLTLFLHLHHWQGQVYVLSCLISLTHFSSFLLYVLRVPRIRLSPSKYSGQSPHLKVLKCSHTCKVLSSMCGNIIHRLWGLAHWHLLLLCLSHWFIPLNWISAKSHLLNEIISPISAFSITPAQYINFKDYSILWKTLYNFFARLLLSHLTGI